MRPQSTPTAEQSWGLLQTQTGFALMVNTAPTDSHRCRILGLLLTTRIGRAAAGKLASDYGWNSAWRAWSPPGSRCLRPRCPLGKRDSVQEASAQGSKIGFRGVDPVESQAIDVNTITVAELAQRWIDHGLDHAANSVVLRITHLQTVVNWWFSSSHK